MKQATPNKYLRHLSELAKNNDKKALLEAADFFIAEVRTPNSAFHSYMFAPKEERTNAAFAHFCDWGLWQHALLLVETACKVDGAVSAHFAVDAQLRCFLELKIRDQAPKLPTKASSKSGLVASQYYVPRLTNSNPRHIVICGMSYCGSTLLDIVLGRLPGVENRGESHWLIDRRKDAGDGGIQKYETCSRCGTECEVLTDEMRSALRHGTVDYYKTLLGDSDKTVVTADKSYHILLRLDPSLAHDAIILFKHPAAMWASYTNRTGRTSAKDQKAYFDRWSLFYYGYIYNYFPLGKKIFINFDQFSKEPYKILIEICRQFGLEFQDSALEYWRSDGHFIAGNYSLRNKLAVLDYSKLVIKPRPLNNEFQPENMAQLSFQRAIDIWNILNRLTVQFGVGE